MKNKLLLVAMGIVLASQMITAQVAQYVPTDGLVGWWSFTGNANDSSTNTNNGTVNGAILTTDRFGNTNSAYNFDGKSNISVPNSNSLQNLSEITISSWIYIDSWFISGGDGYFPILQNSDKQNQFGKYALMLRTSGVLSHLDSQETGIAFSFEFNNWYHVVNVISGNKTTLFINGILVSSTNSGIFPQTPVQGLPLIIGKDMPGLIEYSKGKIDDIGIWNRALTQNEITNLFDAKLVCEKSYATVGYLKASYNPTYEPIIDKSSWHYIAVTKNGLDGNIYLDGKLITNSTYYNQPFIWNSLLLGASQTCVSCSPTPDYIGLIDELRVSNVVRTANEIQNHFNSNVPLSEDNNTLGLFHFDNALGNVMTNSATSKNGILYGGVNYVQGKFGQGLSFDGIDDYARFSQTIPVDSMTIEYWFKSTDDSGTMAMLEYAYNTGIYIQTISGDCQSLSIDDKDDKEVIIKNDIKIYPNPTNNKITIDCRIFANVTGYKIKIFNLIGQEVFGDEMNQQQYIVPLNTLGGQGVYMVKIYDASNKLLDTKKIILQ